MENRCISRMSFMSYVLAAISLLLFFPSSNLSAQDKPRYGGVLKIVYSGSIPGPKIQDAWEMRRGPSVIEPSLEPLLDIDSEGKIHPVLATSWELAPDRSSLTFHLRKGVKFHDGSDFNADVAIWNFQKRIDVHAKVATMWKDIEAIDNYTVRINLKTYKNFLLDEFFGQNSAMISKESYEKNGANMVGTGAFVFESYKPDQVAKFKRNDNYWQKGLPYLDGLELLYIQEPMTQQAALQAGEVDGIVTESGRMMATLSDMGFECESADIGVVAMIPDSNNPESPFSKKAVREAISIAIDREAIVKARGFGLYKATQQHALKGQPGYIEGIDRPYDPEKAKRLLKEAGYPNGFKTRMMPDARTDMDVFVAIQAYLAAIGIDAQIEKAPFSKSMEYRFKGWHNGLFSHPIAANRNMNQWYEHYHLKSSDSPMPWAWPVLKRPEGFNELLAKSSSTTLPDKDLMQKLGKILFDDVTLIPLHTNGMGFVHRKEVHDTGIMEWAYMMLWSPEKAWKSE